MDHAPAAATARPATPGEWLSALRPRQWTKNGAVLVAALFGHRLADAPGIAAALAALAAFCALGSATYLANDVMDREKDRHHPTKSSRPIAAGRIGPGAALGVSALLAGAGLGLSFGVNLRTGLWAVAYLALQVAYTGWLKHAVLLDVGAIATGFVLRVLLGAAAVEVPVSDWLYLCTLLLALFLALSKRRAEIVLLDDGARAHRGVLAHYTVGMIDQLITIITACLVLAYGLYTVSPETVAKVGSDGMKYTLPIVLYGVFRYLYLVHRHGEGGAPERVLLGDRPMLVTVAAYALISAAIVYAPH